MLLAWIEIQQFLVNNSHHVIVLNRISTVFIQQFSSCHWFKKNSADYFEQFSLCHWSKKDFNCFYSTILIISSVWTEFQHFSMYNSNHFIGSNRISAVFIQQFSSHHWFKHNFNTLCSTIGIMSVVWTEFQNFLFNNSHHVIDSTRISKLFIQHFSSCDLFKLNFNIFYSTNLFMSLIWTEFQQFYSKIASCHWLKQNLTNFY